MSVQVGQSRFTTRWNPSSKCIRNQIFSLPKLKNRLRILNEKHEFYQKRFTEFKPVVAQPTIANAIQIGNPVSAKRAVKILRQFDGIVEEATEDELAHAAAKADRTGLFNCPHTGVALAVLLKLVERKEIRSTDRVVVISTANGLKFHDFKIRYHQGTLDEVYPRHVNEPMDIEPDYEKVVKAINNRLR